MYELTSRAHDHQPFYTMRFVEGTTLSEAIEAYHRNALKARPDRSICDRCSSAFVGVCNAVGYAHSRHVVHRDLKGRNVVLGDFGEVMVLDWGLAKVLGSEEPARVDAPADACETHVGQVLGTPAYMAPEQAAGQLDRIGPHTDVYGLGAMLYEILTGRPPFSGKTTEEILAKVRQGGPLPPLRAGGAGTAALEAICLRAMATRTRIATARPANWPTTSIAGWPTNLCGHVASRCPRDSHAGCGGTNRLSPERYRCSPRRRSPWRRDCSSCMPSNNGLRPRAQAVAYSSAADTQRRRAEANFTRAGRSSTRWSAGPAIRRWTRRARSRAPTASRRRASPVREAGGNIVCGGRPGRCLEVLPKFPGPREHRCRDSPRDRACVPKDRRYLSRARQGCRGPSGLCGRCRDTGLHAQNKEMVKKQIVGWTLVRLAD